jgi:hypothetical protein
MSRIERSLTQDHLAAGVRPGGNTGNRRPGMRLSCFQFFNQRRLELHEPVRLLFGQNRKALRVHLKKLTPVVVSA